ncbi:MFS transporter [Candidatus Bathyarchaeota archaeon]|nr:MFS transporter [Candidatus Bathyarchaeota archaeon]
MLSYPRRISYGIGRTGSSLLLTFVDFAGLNIYYSFFLLNPLYAGMASAFGFIVIGLSHWYLGFRSDRTESRFGRRRPYIIIGAPALAITGFLIFVPHWIIPPSPDPINDPTWQFLTFGYYLLTLALFKFFYAFLITAYQAWLPEIADPDERPNVGAIQNTANWIGTGIGIVLGFVSGILFVPISGIPTTIGFIVLVTISLLCFLLFLPAIFFVRSRPGIKPIDRSIVEETKTALKNPNYVKWILVVGFWSLTLSTITAIIVPMLQNGLLLGFTQLILAAGIFLIALMIVPFILARLVKRFGKKRILMAALIILALILPFTAILGLPAFGPVTFQVIAFGIPLGSCVAALYLMRYVVIADIAHKDELESGQARAGMYEGFQGVPLNVFQAIGATFLGWFLLVLQVSPGPPPVNFGFFWWGPVFAIFLVIAAVILHYTNIDPDFSDLEKPLNK